MIKDITRGFVFCMTLIFPLFLTAVAPSSTDLENLSFSVVTYNAQTDVRQSNKVQSDKFLRSNASGISTLMNADPDVINLQEIPLAGIQWLEKNYGKDYQIVYAAKRYQGTENKKNDYLVILYKKSRFEALEKKNFNPIIKTNYFSDDSGNLFLMVRVKDRKTMMPISFVNTHITGGPNRTVGDKQVEEIVHLLQKYTYAVVAGDFNGTVKDVRMVKFADYGIIHDSVMSLTNSSKSRKLDHILYKGSGRSMFIAESCHVDAGIKGSDHYPLTCRVFLQ